MLGAYGEWAAQTMPDPPRLSFRQPIFTNVDAWRAVARGRYKELLLGPGGAATPIPAVQHPVPDTRHFDDARESLGTFEALDVVEVSDLLKVDVP